MNRLGIKRSPEGQLEIDFGQLIELGVVLLAISGAYYSFKLDVQEAKSVAQEARQISQQEGVGYRQLQEELSGRIREVKDDVQYIRTRVDQMADGGHRPVILQERRGR